MIAEALLDALEANEQLAGVQIGINIPDADSGDTDIIDIFTDVAVSEDDSPIRYAEGVINIYANSEKRVIELAEIVYAAIHNKAIDSDSVAILRVRVLDSTTTLEQDTLYLNVLSLEIMTT